MKTLTAPLLSISLIAVALMFQGCPYSADIPLSEKGAPIPEGFCGTWYDTDYLSSDEEDRSKFIVELVDSEKQLLSITKVDEYGEDAQSGHLTQIGDVLFLNYFDSDYGEYGFYKVEYDGLVLRLVPLTTNITEEFESSAELYAFVDANKHLSFFYDHDSPMTLVKKPD